MITALITAYFTFVSGQITRMEKEITELRASIVTIQLKAQIEGLDARLQKVEKQFPPPKIGGPI